MKSRNCRFTRSFFYCVKTKNHSYTHCTHMTSPTYQGQRLLWTGSGLRFFLTTVTSSCSWRNIGSLLIKMLCMYNFMTQLSAGLRSIHPLLLLPQSRLFSQGDGSAPDVCTHECAWLWLTFHFVPREAKLIHFTCHEISCINKNVIFF